MTTKDELLKTRPRQPLTARPAQPVARPAKRVGPRNTAKLNFESLCKLRAGLRMKCVDHRINRAEMDLLRELEALPPVMPKATKPPGTTDAAYNRVWDTFTARMNKALPNIDRLRGKAGLR